jgi:hypothetical protein
VPDDPEVVPDTPELVPDAELVPDVPELVPDVPELVPDDPEVEAQAAASVAAMTAGPRADDNVRVIPKSSRLPAFLFHSPQGAKTCGT